MYLADIYNHIYIMSYRIKSRLELRVLLSDTLAL